MSINFTPEWLNLDNQNLDNNCIKENSNDDNYKLVPVKNVDSKESIKKFLDLCGLRPCYESKEYMEWSKKNIQPYNDYIRKLFSKFHPIPVNNNIDYNLYKEKEYIDDDKEDYYEEMYYMNDMLNEMEEEEYTYDDYYDEHYTSEDEDELSDEYDDDGIDYINSKFNYL